MVSLIDQLITEYFISRSAISQKTLEIERLRQALTQVKNDSCEFWVRTIAEEALKERE